MRIIKHLFCSLILIGSICKTLGQETKEVAISGVHQKVPEGKVWILSNQETSMVLFQRGAFRSGTACNAILHSNPRHIFGISYYDVVKPESRPKTVGFTFKHFEKTFGSDVYLIKPHFLLTDGADGEDIGKSLSWKYEPMEIVFLPGTAVFATSCISEIILFERDITESDIVEYQRKIAQAEQEKKIKEQKALEHQIERQKEREAEKERKEYEKFNSPNAIYDLEEVHNLQEIKFDASNQHKVIQTLIELIKSQGFDELIKYIEYWDIEVSAQWDSTGNVSDIQVVTKNNLKVTQANIDDLKQLLKLNAPPKIKLGDQIRTCSVTSLLFKINFSMDKTVSAVVKMQRKGYKIYSVRLEESWPIVDSILRENYKLYPTRRKLNMYLYRYSFRFVVEPYLFNAVNKEFEKSEWVTSHSVYYPENY